MRNKGRSRTQNKPLRLYTFDGGCTFVSFGTLLLDGLSLGWLCASVRDIVRVTKLVHSQALTFSWRLEQSLNVFVS